MSRDDESRLFRFTIKHSILLMTVVNLRGVKESGAAFAGPTYFYVVTAVNASGESGNSSQVSATPQAPAPQPPTGLTATPGNTQVSLSWSASSGGSWARRRRPPRKIWCGRSRRVMGNWRLKKAD